MAAHWVAPGRLDQQPEMKKSNLMRESTGAPADAQRTAVQISPALRQQSRTVDFGQWRTVR